MTTENAAPNYVLETKKNELNSFLKEFRSEFTEINKLIKIECQKKIDLFIMYYEQTDIKNSLFLPEEDTSHNASLLIEQLIIRRYHLVELIMKVESYIEHIETQEPHTGMDIDSFLKLLQETKGSSSEEIINKFRNAKYDKYLAKIKRKATKK